MRRSKGVSTPEVEGEDGGGGGGGREARGGGWEAAHEDSVTMRINAASQLNQIGAEIQLTAAVRKQGLFASESQVFIYF